MVWAILYAVKTFGRRLTKPSDVIVRFLLVLLVRFPQALFCVFAVYFMLLEEWTLLKSKKISHKHKDC